VEVEKLKKQEGLQKETCGSRQVDCLVVRSVIFSYFQYFINKFKNFIVVFLHFKQHIRSNAPVFIGFTFFLILIPFLVKDVSAFPAQSGFDSIQSNFLSGEHVVEKLSVFRGGHVRQFSVFEYFDKGQEGFFESVKPVSLFFLNVMPNYKYNTNYKDGNGNNNTKESKNVTPSERSEILNVWLNVVQLLMFLFTLFIVFRCTTMKLRVAYL